MPASKARGANQLRNVEKQKKKAARRAPRKANDRPTGSTIGARTRLKKMAGKARAAKAAAKA